MLTEEQLKKIGPNAKALHDRMHEAIDDLMWYQQKEFPAMGNKTPEFLVDQVGAFKEIESRIETVTKTLNGIIDSKMKEGERKVKGDFFTMTLTSVTQSRLNTTRARDYIFTHGGVSAVAACTDEIVMEQHRYKAR